METLFNITDASSLGTWDFIAKAARSIDTNFGYQPCYGHTDDSHKLCTCQWSHAGTQLFAIRAVESIHIIDKTAINWQKVSHLKCADWFPLWRFHYITPNVTSAGNSVLITGFILLIQKFTKQYIPLSMKPQGTMSFSVNYLQVRFYVKFFHLLKARGGVGVQPFLCETT